MHEFILLSDLGFLFKYLFRFGLLLLGEEVGLVESLYASALLNCKTNKNKNRNDMFKRRIYALVEMILTGDSWTGCNDVLEVTRALELKSLGNIELDDSSITSIFDEASEVLIL